MDRVYVTCYVDSDLDGFACAIAYSEFLNKIEIFSVPAIFGTPQIEVGYLMDKFNLEYPKAVDTLKAADKIILVDASTTAGIDKSIRLEKVIEIVDHRKVNDSILFPNAKKQIELIGAAATLIAERFFYENIDISNMSATLLYGAITSNTLNFKSALTSERDIKMAEWLNEKLHLPATFAREMFEAKSDLSGDILRKTLQGDFSQFSMGDKTFCIAQLEIVGAEKLLNSRKEEILKELAKISKENNFDAIFLSIIELEEGCNYFVTDDNRIKKILEEVFKINFNDDIARRPGLIMRKQLIPILKEAIGKIPELL